MYGVGHNFIEKKKKKNSISKVKSDRWQLEENVCNTNDKEVDFLVI